ncbi:MAG: DNA-protecting protein DprA [Holophagaceae bacterium]|nr:DNA-protecting protein DprA [Holophagaceae bacterium]
MANDNIEQALQNIIATNYIRGIGPKKLLTILRAEPLNCTDSEFLKTYFKIPYQKWNIALENAKKCLDMCYELGIAPVLYSTKKYPSLLAQIDDAPVILYTKGNIEAMQSRSIAIIGSRDAHPISIEVANKFAQFFVGKGASVVSGLALGCDTSAHMGTLEAGGKTVAVLAHGLDMIYPATNKKLASEIIDKGGVLVSEYSPLTKPFRTYFVQRDRIQSGLSNASLVVQTKKGAGTMHTANFCIEQKRLLATCYPLWPEISELFTGNLELIDTGQAIPIKSKDDLEKIWNMVCIST